MATHRYSNGNALPPMTSHYDVQGTAHDWEEEKRRIKQKPIYEDGTLTFFWRAHSITLLFLFAAMLAYVGLYEERSTDPQYNIKRGVVAIIVAFILFGVTHLPDGPFMRLHPAVWRFTMILSIVYLLAVIFLLFQDVDHARQMLKELDLNLGKPLPEKDYGGNCLIYDSGNPKDPWHNLWDKIDLFVGVHFFGWWGKTLVLRDWWLCMVFSVMFEVLEYTLEHQLPNFSECWWDHLIMDIIVCNGLGIYFGMKTLNWLSMKRYNWQGMWNIPTYKGKVVRVLTQFTPHSWTDFDWSPTSSLKRWLFLFCIISAVNTFYLKFILWLPSDHFMCQARIIMFLFWGAAGMRETFQYLDDPKCKVWGTQAWICCGIVIAEIIVILKFDWELATMPLPTHMKYFWIVFLSALVIWTIWHFYIQRLLWHTEHKLINRSKSNVKKKRRVKVNNNNNINMGDQYDSDSDSEVLNNIDNAQKQFTSAKRRNYVAKPK